MQANLDFSCKTGLVMLSGLDHSYFVICTKPKKSRMVHAGGEACLDGI